VGVPLWKGEIGPLLRSHGSIGFTTSLPMLASVTHSLAFACGLAFVWYRRFGSIKHLLIPNVLRCSVLIFGLGIAIHPKFRLESIRFASHHLTRAQEDLAHYVDTQEHVNFVTKTPLGLSMLTVVMFVLFYQMIRTCRGPRPGYCDKTRDRVKTMPRLYSKGRYENKMRKRLNARRVKSGQFPPPYPNGYYRVANSTDLPKGKVIPVSCCNRELVLFRGELSGEVGCLDAFCPHLGRFVLLYMCCRSLSLSLSVSLFLSFSV